MAGGHFLTDLAIVLGTAAVTSVIFQRLHQPVVLGYLLAGLLIGPHLPVPLVADAKLVHTLSELGVILLMFSIGLEFSIRKIARLGVPAALTSTVEVGLMVAFGYGAGQLLGWTATESLFAGAAVGISSTMLVAKAFEEEKPEAGFAETVFAVLVFEDLLAIVLLAILTGVASGQGQSTGDLLRMIGELAGFLVAMLAVGLLIVPRFVRAVVGLHRHEPLLIASLGVCFTMALAAELAGYSVALGAFIGGMLVAESGKGHEVEHVIAPFKDAFAAIFFVSAGMTLDPALVVEHAGAIALYTGLVLVGKTVAITLAAFLAGNDVPRALRAGLTLAQIGEFSFIIAGLGLSTGATRPILLPVAIAVSCVTALTTPWLVRHAEDISRRIDAKLPKRVQTFTTFYGAWIASLRAQPAAQAQSLWQHTRGRVIVLALDAVMLIATIIGTSVLFDRLVAKLVKSGFSERWAATIVLSLAVIIAALFLFGMLRVAARLARILATRVVPARADGKLDLGTAPRRALLLTLELAIVSVVLVPVAAVTQPFLGGGVLLFGVIIVGVAFAVWRSMGNLSGHVRAGSELIVEALARQSRLPTAPPVAGGGAAPAPPPDELAEVRAMLPGFPGLMPARLDDGDAAIGRSLGELNLRAITGASVLVIQRPEGGAVMPTAGEVLRAGDVLALAGTDEAVAAARELLRRGPDPEPAS